MKYTVDTKLKKIELEIENPVDSKTLIQNLEKIEELFPEYEIISVNQNTRENGIPWVNPLNIGEPKWPIFPYDGSSGNPYTITCNNTNQT